MTTTATPDVQDATGDPGPWWLFLITGIAWTIIAFVLLALKPGAVTMISFLVGFVLIFAGINELISLSYALSWKWLHVIFGVTFILAGLIALLQPFQTFGVLALLIGWYLLFKGLFTTIVSIVEHRSISLWGLLLACGIVEMAIGVWAIGYPGRSAWLLIIWVGIGALLRGITEIITAFELHHRKGQTALAVA
jgi:uncharacterized membrane protein HdeD (DUF308 family)